MVTEKHRENYKRGITPNNMPTNKRLRGVSYFSLLHAKPQHASGEAACREKRGRKPEKKK